MSAESGFSHSWAVGRWTATLTMPPIVPGAVRHAICEWSPSLPGRRFTAAEQRQYDAGLAKAMQLAQEAQQESR